MQHNPRTCSWTNCARGYAATNRFSGSGWPSTPSRAILPVLQLGPRTQNAAHLLIHSLRQILAPDCLLIFTSDGLNLYFYALTAYFGHWLAVRRRGRKVSQWQVAAGLLYGQVKKSYRRRKLARVTYVMRVGTGAALKVARPRMGLSGRLNTAFIERVNLTVRHGVAALARRTWAIAKPAPQLLAHLEWWRADSHFVRPHASLRVALVQPAAARRQADGATLPPTYRSSGSGENQPTMGSAGSAVLSPAPGTILNHVRATEVRRRPVKWPWAAR